MTTTIRALWSDRFLYLGYECPYTKLTTFEPPQTGSERYDLAKRGASLWDRDVVEAFIGTSAENIRRYAEFEVSPSNERLDLMLDLPQKDFAWDSRFESAVKVDHKAKLWRCEMRIPLEKLSETKPTAGARWRANLFRCDRANQAFLSWRPVMTGNFHTPERFGVLEFVE